jgi:hypothetical protein
MKKLNGAFSLLGAAAVSTFAFPAFADTATGQIGTQSTTINGDNNQVTQVINQVNISHPGLGRGLGNNARRTSGQSGTVQDAYQGATIDGSGNSVYQEINQVNQVSQPGAKPGQRVGQQNRPGQRGNSPQQGRDRD